jgi:hypothetical protein
MKDLSKVAELKSDKVLELLASGNIDQFTQKEKVEYVTRVCEVVGLNPLTRPFEFIRFQNKTVLYASKGCADQLRRIHNISIRVTDKRIEDGVLFITVEGQDGHGRVDSDIGALPVAGLKGDAMANQVMKCLTKAKRRLTLSMCGLGMLDESEFDTMGPMVAEGKKEMARIDAAMEKASTEDYLAKDETLESIKFFLGKLSEGRSNEEKCKLLNDACGVSKFNDLKLKSNGELLDLNKKLSELITNRPKNHAKPSFTLDQ